MHADLVVLGYDGFYGRMVAFVRAMSISVAKPSHDVGVRCGVWLRRSVIKSRCGFRMRRWWGRVRPERRVWAAQPVGDFPNLPRDLFVVFA